MLFWLFVIILAVGVIMAVIGWWMFDNTRYDTGWLQGTGTVVAVFAGCAVIISGIVMAVNYVGVEARVAKQQETYKSLTYQLENNLYDNDNDVGKKELYTEITEWNAELEYYQTIQDDFWIGIYYPDVFDQLEFIDLGGCDD